jgi:hypothetical protein
MRTLSELETFGGMMPYTTDCKKQLPTTKRNAIKAPNDNLFRRIGAGGASVRVIHIKPVISKYG